MFSCEKWYLDADPFYLSSLFSWSMYFPVSLNVFLFVTHRDGTSIVLSDDVGQIYLLNTGQGESQEDAKYDQVIWFIKYSCWFYH